MERVLIVPEPLPFASRRPAARYPAAVVVATNDKNDDDDDKVIDLRKSR